MERVAWTKLLSVFNLVCLQQNRQRPFMNYYKNIFKSIKVQLICYICLLTTVPLLFVCIVEYYSSKNAIEQRVIEQLTSIADLKKIELNNGWKSV